MLSFLKKKKEHNPQNEDGWKIKRIDKEYRRWTYEHHNIKFSLAFCFSTWKPKVYKVLVHNQEFQKILREFILRLGNVDLPKKVYISYHQNIDKYSLSGPYQDGKPAMNGIGEWIEGEQFQILV